MSLERNGYAVPTEIERVVQNFAEMTDIPRPTGGEAAISAHLVEKARALGFEVKLDERGNMAIDVPATEGCDGWQRVIFQGHMDMVTKGGNDLAPTQAYIDEEGWMCARGTTLGADNGMGVSIAFALAEDPELRHGPLTILVTVHEEATPMGARFLDPEIVPEGESAIVINLDSEEGPTMICRGCAASSDVTAEFEIGDKENLPEGYTVLRLSLGGLVGGHSGVNIHEGRGNAIKLMNSFLLSLEETGLDFKLIDYQGGERRNIIPSDAGCTIAVPDIFVDVLERNVSAFQAELREIGFGDGLTAGHAAELSFESERVSVTEGLLALSDHVREMILAAVEGVENGPIEISAGEWGGGVRLSNNVAILQQLEDCFRLISMARGAEGDKLRVKLEKMKADLTLAGARSVESTVADGDWLEPDDSPAVAIAVEACRKMLKVDPVVFAYHAGLEAPHVLDKLEERFGSLSAASVGPIIRDAHSTAERVSVDSIAQVYAYVKQLLGMVNNEK